MSKKAYGVDLIDSWLAVLEDGKVVLPEGLSDDFWEKVEVGLADYFKAGVQVDSLAEASAHVDVAGVEVLDHEHRSGDAFEGIEHLAKVAELEEKVVLKLIHGG
jgi:hypothetical protein